MVERLLGLSADEPVCASPAGMKRASSSGVTPCHPPRSYAQQVTTVRELTNRYGDAVLGAALAGFAVVELVATGDPDRYQAAACAAVGGVGLSLRRKAPARGVPGDLGRPPRCRALRAGLARRVDRVPRLLLRLALLPRRARPRPSRLGRRRTGRDRGRALHGRRQRRVRAGRCRLRDVLRGRPVRRRRRDPAAPRARADPRSPRTRRRSPASVPGSRASCTTWSRTPSP